MTELISDVQKLVVEEYERESEIWGKLLHSDHESYALLLEEFEEAREEVTNTENALMHFWKTVKAKYIPDTPKKETLNSIQTFAILAACEFIQVAELAYKARRTVEERMEDE